GRRKQHPVVEAGRILPFDKSGDGGQAGLRRGDRPARGILLPHRHRQQRPDTVRHGEEQVGDTERRGRALRQPHLQLLRHHHGSVHDGREEGRHHQRGPVWVYPNGPRGRRDRRMQRRHKRARGRVQWRPRVLPRRPSAQAAGPGLLPRRRLRPQASPHRRPAGCRLRERDQRVLRERGRLGGEGDCLPTSNICRHRDGYVYWDWVHATQRAAKMAAEAFFHGPAQFTMPLTFKQLAEKKGADLMEQ
uniref:GDSL esterase/lipase n=1 Tax=Aegilops tauschii subsp. strangulata TaxID=200361 RepID=A0A453J6H1_AEGTS